MRGLCVAALALVGVGSLSVVEDFQSWAADYLQKAAEKRGQLRAVLVDESGQPMAAHVRPELPRMIEQWSGYSWEPVALAPDLASARRVLYPDAAAAFTEVAPPVRRAPGRHRKPSAAGQ